MANLRLIAGVIAIVATATNTGLAQQSPAHVVKPKPFSAPPSPVAPPPVQTPHTLAVPARNAIGLPAASPAANAIATTHEPVTMHEPGAGGPNNGAVKPGPVGIGGIHPDTQHAPAAALTAKGALSGSQMGRPKTGAAMLGGSATHAPTAVIGHSPLSKH